MAALRRLPAPDPDGASPPVPETLARDLWRKSSEAGRQRVRQRIITGLGKGWETLATGADIIIARRIVAAADGALRHRPVEDPAMERHRCVEVHDLVVVGGMAICTQGLMAASYHALGRLVQRHGAREVEGVLAVVSEAHNAVLRLPKEVYLDTVARRVATAPDAHRLSLLVPAGPGAFLADLLLVDIGLRYARPFLALRSWLHDDQMRGEQAEAVHVWRRSLLPPSRHAESALFVAILNVSEAGEAMPDGAAARESRLLGVVPRRSASAP